MVDKDHHHYHLHHKEIIKINVNYHLSSHHYHHPICVFKGGMDGGGAVASWLG